MLYVWLTLILVLLIVIFVINKLSGRPKGDPREHKKKSEFNIVAKGYPDEDLPEDEYEKRKDKKEES